MAYLNDNHDIYTNNHNSRKTERKEIKITLQVVKPNELPARKTINRYHLTKKTSLTNQLEVMVF